MSNMEELYKLFKGKLITYPNGVEGKIIGYVDDNLLIATEQNPTYSFRKFGKQPHYIEEEYKDKKWRYCYLSEQTVEEQYGRQVRKL